MPRRRRAPAGIEPPRPLPPAAPDPPPGVHTIHPTAVYSAEDFRRVFKLRQSSLRREVREKRLRVVRRCGRYYLLGKWIIAWLEADGAGGRERPAPANGRADGERN
jgi:hypothetical protein